jgi:anthranilate synthase component 1
MSVPEGPKFPARAVVASLPHMTRGEFDAVASKGATVAIYRTALLDGLTPASVFAALHKKGEPGFFLESARAGRHIARYSFVGANPSRTLLDQAGHVSLKPSRGVVYSDLFAALRAECEEAHAVRVPGLPRFAGGWVGFAGWDVARGAVGLPRRRPEHEPPPADGLPDALFHRFDDVVVFDHLTNKIVLIANVDVGDVPSEAWRAGQHRLDKTEAVLVEALARGWAYPEPVDEIGEPAPEEARLSFQEQVEIAKRHLVAGDIFQVVLSRTMGLRTRAQPLAIYRALSAINPSPYLLYYDTGDAVIYGSSPELLVRVQEGRVHIRPLAGTRARGKTTAEDRTTEFELLDSEKERAEHLMLVDLSRNDVGVVSQLGSVSVDEFMTVERYLHVMHLVSHISGKLDPRFDRFDAFKAGFPAGTMSGAPKRRAVEIIGELEGNARGFYAGALGYVDLAGGPGNAHGLEMAIPIRCLVQRGDKVLIRTGAGIVYNSDAESELRETESKAKSLIAAIRLAERGLRL